VLILGIRIWRWAEDRRDALPRAVETKWQHSVRYSGPLVSAVNPLSEWKYFMPVSHGKIARQNNRQGTIFSQTVIVKHSPLCDLFTITVCKKIAPRRFIHDRRLWENCPLLFDRLKFAPMTETFWTGEIFSRGD